MIVTKNSPSQELPDARNAKLLAAKLSRPRGAIPSQQAAAPAVGGSTEPQAPSKQAGSNAEAATAAPANDQNRGLVPEGAEAAQASESAQPEAEAQAPTGEKAKTTKKFHRLLAQKAEAAAENAQLKAELETIKAQVAGLQRPQQGTPPQQAQPQKRVVEFTKPFPENGTTEEQFIWKAEKAGHDAAQRVFTEQLPGQLGESFGKFAQVISPALQHTLGQMVDAQWAGMKPNLEAIGVSVEDVRPLVEQEVTNNPGLGIEEALGRVLFHRNFSAHWQDEPETAAPAAARAPARPAGPARGQVGSRQPLVKQGEDPVEVARALKRSGQKFQSEALMAAHLSSIMRGRKAQ